jgi:hypothetical protein
MLDVSRLQPEARPIVEAAAEIYLRHSRPWFIGLIAHGSALKGGFIPGCSDIDLQLYLEDAAFVLTGILSLDIGMAVQRDLARIEPAPFQYIQCYPYPRHLPEGHIGPIPGAYHVVTGTLPIPEATVSQLRDSARHSLATLDALPSFIPHTLLQHGGGKLARQARLLCTKVWPILYQILVLQQENAPQIWCLPKEQAIALLPADSHIRQTILRFYRAVCAYYPDQRSVEQALEVYQSGLAFLRAARLWWDNTVL